VNIVVRNAAGRYFVRPDTTRDKNNEDYFPTDNIRLLTCTPAITVSISRSGKYIGSSFVRRYYDTLGVGLLLYPENMITGREEDFACASCLDHTSYIPVPEITLSEYTGPSGEMTLTADGMTIWQGTLPDIALIDSAIREASEILYLRKGDIIVIELSSRINLAEREGSNRSISLKTGDKTPVFFDIRFE